MKIKQDRASRTYELQVSACPAPPLPAPTTHCSSVSFRLSWRRVPKRWRARRSCWRRPTRPWRRPTTTTSPRCTSWELPSVPARLPQRCVLEVGAGQCCPPSPSGSCRSDCARPRRPRSCLSVLGTSLTLGWLCPLPGLVRAWDPPIPPRASGAAWHLLLSEIKGCQCTGMGTWGCCTAWHAGGAQGTLRCAGSAVGMQGCCAVWVPLQGCFRDAAGMLCCEATMSGHAAARWLLALLSHLLSFSPLSLCALQAAKQIKDRYGPPAAPVPH